MALWQQLSGAWKPQGLTSRIATRTVTLDELPRVCEEYIAGTVTGRTLVRIG